MVPLTIEDPVDIELRGIAGQGHQDVGPGADDQLGGAVLTYSALALDDHRKVGVDIHLERAVHLAVGRENLADGVVGRLGGEFDPEADGVLDSGRVAGDKRGQADRVVGVAGPGPELHRVAGGGIARGHAGGAGVAAAGGGAAFAGGVRAASSQSILAFRRDEPERLPPTSKCFALVQRYDTKPRRGSSRLEWRPSWTRQSASSSVSMAHCGTSSPISSCTTGNGGSRCA